MKMTVFCAAVICLVLSSLVLGQAGAAEIYLNGKLLLSGDQQNNAEDRWLKTFIFEKTTTHLLAIRYTNKNITTFHSADFEAVFFIRIGDVDAMVDAGARRLGILTSYQMFFTSLSIAVGLLHLILFFFFPRLRQNAYFALFLFSYAGAIFFDYQSSLAINIGKNLLFMRFHRAVMPFSSYSDCDSPIRFITKICQTLSFVSSKYSRNLSFFSPISFA
ncbi:MAG: hypothetical protein ACE5I1_17245 [bacterium]